MPSHRLTVNGQRYLLEDVDPAKPLLWVLREDLGLVGTKYSCGIGVCGACAVWLNGTPTRSCATPLTAAAGQDITTIEGLASPNGALHRIQQAWIDLDVPQCGFCQSGQIMAAAALLEKNPLPTDEDIDAAMSGHLCRCYTYNRIRAAIHAAAEMPIAPEVAEK